MGNRSITDTNPSKEIGSVWLDLSLVLSNWHPENPLLPPKKLVDEFIDYLFTGRWTGHHKYVLAICASMLEDVEMERFLTLLLYLVEISRDPEQIMGAGTSAADKKGVSLGMRMVLRCFSGDFITKLGSETRKCSDSMKVAATHVLVKEFGDDVYSSSLKVFSRD